MLKNSKKIVSIAAMLALLEAATIGCAPTATAAVAVKTASVQKQSIQSQITISGVLVPESTVTLSSKMIGEVQTVAVQVGSAVKKGDTLVTLDTKQLNVQLQQAEAALKQANDAVSASKSTAAASSSAYKSAQAAADQAKINMDLQQTLFNNAQNAHNAGTMDDMSFTKIGAALDVAKSQYAVASGSALEQAKNASGAASKNVVTLEAAVDVAQANLDLVNVSLQNATISSPVDGVVANRNINPGELATVGTQLLTLIDSGSLKLKGTVPQNALPLLSVGQAIQVAVDIYPGKTYEAQISMIAPESVTTGQYFPIEIKLQNADGL
ncbi:MAG: HlyD family efflux transporter periplasmic adaptor subunit, partial [Eubacteriales bacterium]